jgi:hypothetical protein
VWEPGTQNNCRDDFIYIDRLFGCVYIGEATRYVIYPGNYFHLSGRQTAILTVVAGSVSVWTDARRRIYLLPGQTIRSHNWMAVQASPTNDARLVLTLN